MKGVRSREAARAQMMACVQQVEITEDVEMARLCWRRAKGWAMMARSFGATAARQGLRASAGA